MKWEYLFLTLAREPGGLFRKGGSWKVKYVNGEELANWNDGPAFYDYCNQLGEEGWEIVGFSQSPVFGRIVGGWGGGVEGEIFRIVLKRPRR
jgi:hypothetical protein